jgi:NAD(P)-dependent dehydrogenase (short-subunit alcohol dehydrogenase family)
VAIVAQMTGYPPELLDVDLDLEADLGVDTVKQAEVFAAVRERFGVERDPNVQLRDFPTLTHVIGWIRDKTGIQPGGGSAAAPAQVAATQPQHLVHTTPTITGDLAATDTLPRRVPVPSLRPSLEQCVPTGVVLDGDSRLVVMLDEGGVGTALVKKLQKLGATVLTLEPGTPTDEIVSSLAEFASAGGVQGVYWLPALDDEGPLTAMDVAGWRENLRRRVKALYASMRALYEHTPFLVTGTRLGGFHGYDEAGATAPMGGSVTGFAKAYFREKGEDAPLVKAVDFPASRKTTALAEVLVAETLTDPGCVEVGYGGDARWTVGLLEQPFPAEPGPEAFDLNPGMVAVVTGAAGSIVSAITADLAQAAGGGTFHLLDLTPAPDPDDPDLQAYVQDKAAFKMTVANRLKERGERPTPVVIEKEMARYERLQAALTAVQAVEDAGGTACYHSLDLRDYDAVAAVVAEVAEKSGRIDLLLHAAGIEISRALPDKPPEQFDLVVDVKADGWFNLLRAAGDLPIGATVGFSSVAGRFGNAGQTDYSSANDLLCKTTSAFRTTRPDTRGYVMDWTAWGGIGMATRGSIPTIMAALGVQMLPPEAGVAWIRRELISGVTPREVVVAGSLGTLFAGEPSPTGGLDLDSVPTQDAGPMVGEVVTASMLNGLTVRTTLDPAQQPFLDDHRYDGPAMFPGVMYMEAFAEVSRLLLPHWHVVAVEHVRFMGGMKFFRDAPRTVTITSLVQPVPGDPNALVADCAFMSERILPGSDTPQQTVHARGRVRLATTPLDPEKASKPPTSSKNALSPDDVYSVYFHGPAYQVMQSVWRAKGEGAVSRFAEDLPANHVPSDAPVLIGPRLAEICFQTAGMWEMGQEGKFALPDEVGSLRVFGTPTERTPLVCTARPTEDGFDCLVQRTDGTVVVHMTGYRTVVTPQPLPDEQASAIRAVMG